MPLDWGATSVFAEFRSVERRLKVVLCTERRHLVVVRWDVDVGAAVTVALCDLAAEIGRLAAGRGLGIAKEGTPV